MGGVMGRLGVSVQELGGVRAGDVRWGRVAGLGR